MCNVQLDGLLVNGFRHPPRWERRLPSTSSVSITVIIAQHVCPTDTLGLRHIGKCLPSFFCTSLHDCIALRPLGSRTSCLKLLFPERAQVEQENVQIRVLAEVHTNELAILGDLASIAVLRKKVRRIDTPFTFSMCISLSLSHC